MLRRDFITRFTGAATAIGCAFKESINRKTLALGTDQQLSASFPIERGAPQAENKNERAAPVITLPARPSLFLQKWSQVAALPNPGCVL